MDYTWTNHIRIRIPGHRHAYLSLMLWKEWEEGWF